MNWLIMTFFLILGTALFLKLIADHQRRRQNLAKIKTIDQFIDAYVSGDLPSLTAQEIVDQLCLFEINGQALVYSHAKFTKLFMDERRNRYQYQRAKYIFQIIENIWHVKNYCYE